MQLLAYAAAGLIGLWGVAHAVPTRQVVAGFAPSTADNRRILLQEWLAESITMAGAATLVAAATAVAGSGDVVVWVYRVVAGLLIALAALTAVTGARTAVIWFKLCPVLLGTAAAMPLVASVL